MASQPVWPSHSKRAEGTSSSKCPQSAFVVVVLGWTAATFQSRVGSKGKILLQVQWATGQQKIK